MLGCQEHGTEMLGPMKRKFVDKQNAFKGRHCSLDLLRNWTIL